MPSPPNAPVRIIVLHVGNSPLSQVRRDQLSAVGVDVEILTPTEVDAAFPADRGVRFEGLERAAREMSQRVASADVLVLDEGTGLRRATMLFGLRREEGLRNLTTVKAIAEVDRGRLIANPSSGRETVCRLVRQDDLFFHLRLLGSQDPPWPSGPRVAISVRDGTRPPFPLPYAARTNRFTRMDSPRVAGGIPMEMRYAGGEQRLPELLEPGAVARFSKASAMEVLLLLIKHLPTTKLHLLSTPTAGEWWDQLVAQILLQDPLQPREQNDWIYESRQGILIRTVVWHATARDGGRDTLGALPELLYPLREIAAQDWTEEAEHLAWSMSMEFSDASCLGLESIAVQVLREWGVAVWEDPMGPDTDPGLYRPTLSTHRAARRYRSTPDVVRLSLGRWGGRPYHEGVVARQLVQFVAESPPTSRGELEEWVRLIHALPAGRARDLVCQGINAWPRIEFEMVEAWPTDNGFEFEGWKVPCWDENRQIAAEFASPGDDFPGQRLLQVLRLQDLSINLTEKVA